MTDIEKIQEDVKDIHKNVKWILFKNNVLLPIVTGLACLTVIMTTTWVCMADLRQRTIEQTKLKMIEEGWTPPSTNSLTATPVQE